MVYNFTNDYSRIVCELEEYMEQLVLAPESRLTIAKKGIEKSRSTLVELKRLVIKNGFPDSKSEIHFFKEIKPAVQSYLLFYQAVFDVESLRPKYHSKRLKKYMQRKLEEIQIFMQQESRCVQYYNCCFTYLDELYFIRDREDIPIELRGNNYLEDGQFVTWRDQTFAEIRAREMLTDYLLTEIRKLGQVGVNSLFRLKKGKWTGKKIYLAEIIYALDSAKVIDNGRMSIQELTQLFGYIFGVDLTKDIYDYYKQIRGRKKDQTLFLNFLRDVLQQRIDEKLS
ncbi:RteC domain-containing protein [Mangrovibacterium lignilyticum]|uniref:RteC domain-containing protein n=1 Tax=Mangrovibacterium lignilyticum TaxID=2668052 RepID=UPI0013D2C46A|nr:RteC domain-containing protein [Mangrovibacterium lignilyticum]